MHPTQHMMESTHVWASTQTEEQTTPTMLPSTFKCKVSISKAALVLLHHTSNTSLVESPWSLVTLCCVTCSNTVPPEVQVTATLTRVVVGNSTTLTCTVTRSNPMGSYTYRWVHNNSITLSETSSMLTVNIMTESNLGTYHCEVTNSAGLSGNGTTTIELGGKHWY